MLAASVVGLAGVAAVPAGRAVAAAPSGINVIAVHSGKCVAVEGSSQLPGAPVVQAECAGQGGATWTLRPASSGGGAVNLVNALSGLCLELGSVSGTVRARQAECGGQEAADFRFEDRGTFAWIQPSAGTPAQCVEVVGASHIHGAPLGLTDCHGRTGTAFRQRQPQTGNDPVESPQGPVVSVADVDGDRKGDLVVLGTEGVVSVRRNLGGRFDSGAAWSKGWSNYLGRPGQGRLYFADVTGDGKADMVVHGTDGEVSVRTNLGNHFDGGTVWSRSWSNYLGRPGQGRLYFADVTGDGKADMVVHGTDGEVSIRTNKGNHFDGGTPWSNNWSNFLGHPGQGRLYFADMTGDARADMVVHGTNGEVSVRTNKGNHFDGGTVWSSNWSNFLGMPGQGRLHFADVLGDVKADLVVQSVEGAVGGRTNLGGRFDGGTPMGDI
ncbi:FG-GAP-like repeat-containing protein [Streptomyces typhae]|uniref:FG-GAP-like repeat-containing protein n=1 Tax=Streptomyces typhae TaxID=2681492 RepID=UPI0012F624BB